MPRRDPNQTNESLPVNRTMHALSSSRSLFAAITSAALCVGLHAHAVAGDVWYKQPAQGWTDAAPLGNGLTAAMVFGGTKTERIALNNSSFWSGRPHDYNDPNAGMAVAIAFLLAAPAWAFDTNSNVRPGGFQFDGKI